MNIGGGEKKLLRRAHNVLQMVMERLEELFKRMLVENRQCFDPEHMLVSSIAINGNGKARGIVLNVRRHILAFEGMPWMSVCLFLKWRN